MNKHLARGMFCGLLLSGLLLVGVFGSGTAHALEIVAPKDKCPGPYVTIRWTWGTDERAVRGKVVKVEKGMIMKVPPIVCKFPSINNPGVKQPCPVPPFYKWPTEGKVEIRLEYQKKYENGRVGWEDADVVTCDTKEEKKHEKEMKANIPSEIQESKQEGIRN